MVRGLIGALGWIAVVAGVFLLSPLTDVLPIDMLFWFQDCKQPHCYFRVTSGSSEVDLFSAIGAVFLALGVAILAIDKIVARYRRT